MCFFQFFKQSWPAQASIVKCVDEKANTLCKHICGGTLIDLTTIITAAHCLTESPKKYKIYLGLHNFNDFKNPLKSPPFIKVTKLIKVIIHF